MIEDSVWERNPILFLLWSWKFWGGMVIRNRYYR